MTPWDAPQAGEFGTPPDIGSPTSRIVALVLVGLLYAVLALAQNLTPYLTPKPDPLGRRPAAGEVAKIMLLLGEAFERAGGPAGEMFGRAAAAQYANDRLYPADKLQAVLVLGETESPEAALAWLSAIEGGVELGPLAAQLAEGGDWQSQLQSRTTGNTWAVIDTPDGEQLDEEVVADAEAMRALYGVGPGSLTTEQSDRLRDRYAWLGELAVAPDGSAEREALFADIPWVIALIALAMLIFTVAILGGLTMSIVAAVYFFTGRLKPRFVPPPRGGSVFLETFAVFLAGFGVMHFGSGLAAMLIVGPPASGPMTPPEQAAADSVMRWIMLGTLAAQWCLLLTIFWPRLRGVSWSGWRDAVGWRAPRGVWREILAGIAGYFAGLPLLLAAMVVTVVLNLVVQALSEGPIETPENPMVELVASGDVLVIALFLSLATVWAPIVEETLFRGGLFRHMRARHGAFVCAVATALLFAFLHPYGPLLVWPVLALGFIFALIREWRGSLIGSVTAHCLHNATAMTLMLVGLQAVT